MTCSWMMASFTCLVLGCGDNESLACPVVFAPDGFMGMRTPSAEHCGVALLFVARDSPTLTPAQADVDRYFDRWVRAIESEPALARGAPQRYRGVPTDIMTRNPALIDTLTSIANSTGSRAIPPTGDETFDGIMMDLMIPEVLYGGVDAVTSESIFGLHTGAIHNQELLHTRLLATSSRLPDPLERPYKSDGKWAWEGLESGIGDDNATAIIDLTFGWGDCFVTCEGLRDLQAIVPAEGSATVYDLGGDPLPSSITLNPNTQPPP
jgi:hypothetical protein